MRVYLNIGSLPKKVMNVMNEMARMPAAILARTPIVRKVMTECTR